MSPLRVQFIKHLQLKGYTEPTQRNYVAALIGLSRHYNLSPDKLTIKQIQDYLLYLRNGKHLNPRTINLHRAAIVAFFTFVKPDMDIGTFIPVMKVPRHIPSVLTRDEVERLLKAISNIKHYAVAILLYSSGLRLNECRTLKVSDIDGKEMLVRVRNGKGNKERFTILSKRAHIALQKYYKACRPKTYLFKGKNKLYTRGSISRIVAKAATKARIKKRVHPHTLRHSFATHLFENGVSLQIIQRLLGHSSIKTTTVYTHISQATIRKVASPLDAPYKEGEDA